MQQAQPWFLRLWQERHTPVGRGALLITIASFTFGFAMNANQNIVSNYFEHVLHLDGPQFGYITAIREIPGFLLIFLTALFYRVSIPKLSAGALTLLAIGYLGFGSSVDIWTVAPWVIISSMGYHTYLQTNHALGMSLTTERRTGSILGRLSSIHSAGALAAMLVVMLGFQFRILDFHPTFVLAGLMALIAAIAIAGFPNLRDGKLEKAAAERDPIVLTKEYRYYYLLNLLDGGRQQIFFSFGLWVLVHRYNLDVPLISGVLFCTTALVMLTGPRIGRLIDRHGERYVLGWVNIAYIVALAGYALVDNVILAIGFYVIYSFIFPLSNIGAATYLRKVAVYKEIAPSLAMGLTMQHVAAVAVPMATGYILNYVGYQVPFFIAAVFACLTIVVTRRLDPTSQKSPRRLAEEARRQAAEAHSQTPAATTPTVPGQPASASASGGND